jgi:hypothetical protein
VVRGREGGRKGRRGAVVEHGREQGSRCGKENSGRRDERGRNRGRKGVKEGGER